MEWFGRIIKEIVKGILAFVICGVGGGGFYPLLPAYFAVCCMEGKTPVSVILGAAAGIVFFIPLDSMLRYVFILVVIGLGVRIFIWINRSCDSMSAGIIAAVAAVVMNFVSTPQWAENGLRLLLGICEGAMVLGLCMGIHVLLEYPFRLDYFLKKKDKPGKGTGQNLPPPSVHRVESLAYAVSGLSDALFAMSLPKDITDSEEELCENCHSREICWKEHHGQALKIAWNNRLMENRYIIAQQLDAMADLMQEWTKIRMTADYKYTSQLAAAIYGAKEKGLQVEELHVYEEKDKLCLEGYVSTRWDGGILLKNYVHVVEKAFGKNLQPGKGTKNILTGEPALVCLYEDRVFYALQGAVTEKKSDSEENGDKFSCFSMDDGHYHICLSDGMGSGTRAGEESEMVVELMQKFIEAGFKKEIAVGLMNSAMVLHGEDDYFSTLDYGVIDMYTGELELVKIGGAATYIKHKDGVECIDTGTLPAGADAKMKVESVKRTLTNGDFLVMVTDGVIEYLHVRNPKDVIADIIGRAKTENAQGLAEYIMMQVMILIGGFPKDDMTVLVTGIWEKE